MRRRWTERRSAGQSARRCLLLAGVPAYLLWLLIAAALPTQAGASGAPDDRGKRAFSLPEPSLRSAHRLRLWATYYYTHEAKRADAGVPFSDRHGVPLSDPVDPRDWCIAAVQGSVRAPRNGATVMLTLAGQGSGILVDCARILADRFQGPWVEALGRSYFAPAIGPLGDGEDDHRLVPLRTIAVDPTVIPFGTVLYIPAARGVVVEVSPGIWVKHDGFFFAGDEGPGIKGRHIDVFCGVSAESCFPDLASRAGGHVFDAYIIRDKAISRLLSKAHRSDTRAVP